MVIGSSEPVDMGGFEILSPSGGLVPIQQVAQSRPERYGAHVISEPMRFAAPTVTGFKWIVSNEPERMAWTTDPGTFVTLDGDLTTGIRSESEDLSLRWFERNSIDVHETSLSDTDIDVGNSIVDLDVFADFAGPAPGVPWSPLSGLREPGLPPSDMVYERDLESLLELQELYRLPRGDFNRDGTTDLADLAIMTFNERNSFCEPDPDPSDSTGNLGVSINENRSVVVSSSRPIRIGALEFRSPDGGLSLPEGALQQQRPVRFEDFFFPPPLLNQEVAAMPGMKWVLANEPDRIALAPEFGWSVTLDGDLTTPVRSQTDNLTLNWFERGDIRVHSRAINEGDARTGRLIVEPPTSPIFKENQPEYLTIERPDPFDVALGLSENTAFLPDEFLFAADEESLLVAHEVFDIPRGDVNGDGLTDARDGFAFRANFGSDVVGYVGGDVNSDGVVSLADYAILQNHLGDSGFVPDLPPALPEANPGLWIDAGGNILIASSDPVLIGGFEVYSPSGGIRLSSSNGNGNRPGNFSQSLTRDVEGLVDRFTWVAGADAFLVDPLGGAAGDGEPGELSGTLVTNIAESDDLVLRWFEPGNSQIFTHRVGEGDPPNNDLQFFDRYPACNDPDRDPARTCSLVDDSPEIRQLDQAKDLETLLELHEELNIARGDITGNRIARTPLDVLRMASNFGNEADKYSDGDLNLDSIVDFADVAIFGANAGSVGFEPDPELVEPVEAFIYVADDGKLVISSDEVLPLGGIELTSASGGLLPPDVGGALFGGVAGGVGPLPTVFRNDEVAVVWANPFGDEGLFEDWVTPISFNEGTDDIVFRYYLSGSEEVFQGEVELPDFIPVLIGDINDDGEVGFGDFLILSDNFGATAATKADGDLTGDGSIDFADFLLLSDNFGDIAAATVPEPAGWWSGLFCLALCRCVRPSYESNSMPDASSWRTRSRQSRSR